LDKKRKIGLERKGHATHGAGGADLSLCASRSLKGINEVLSLGGGGEIPLSENIHACILERKGGEKDYGNEENVPDCSLADRINQKKGGKSDSQTIKSFFLGQEKKSPGGRR